LIFYLFNLIKIKGGVTQTAAKAERDIRKQQREERNAENKGLVDFRRHDPPQFLGETEPDMSGEYEWGMCQWLSD
jgi:hypothetical protein